MHKHSLNGHLLSHKNDEHMVESGRHVAGTGFHKLAGGREIWLEVVNCLISRSLALTLMWSVHQNKSDKNAAPYIHYTQYNERQCEMNSVQHSPDSEKELKPEQSTLETIFVLNHLNINIDAFFCKIFMQN